MEQIKVKEKVEVASVLNKLSLTEERLFIRCCVYCNYDKIINLSKDYREFSKWEFGLAEQTLRNCITNLVKEGLLIRVAKGVYQVDVRW